MNGLNFLNNLLNFNEGLNGVNGFFNYTEEQKKVYKKNVDDQAKFIRKFNKEPMTDNKRKLIKIIDDVIIHKINNKYGAGYQNIELVKEFFIIFWTPKIIQLLNETYGHSNYNKRIIYIMVNKLKKAFELAYIRTYYDLLDDEPNTQYIYMFYNEILRGEVNNAFLIRKIYKFFNQSYENLRIYIRFIIINDLLI